MRQLHQKAGHASAIKQAFAGSSYAASIGMTENKQLKQENEKLRERLREVEDLKKEKQHQCELMQKDIDHLKDACIIQRNSNEIINTSLINCQLKMLNCRLISGLMIDTSNFMSRLKFEVHQSRLKELL